MIQKELGARIRELRKAQGYSQETFAKKSSIDRTYIASVEAGKRNISIENIKKISDALEISLDELFDFTKPIHNTMLITINRISFILEAEANLSQDMKDEIELTAKFAFDKEESSILEFSNSNTIEELREESVFNIMDYLKKAIERDLKIKTAFKAIDTEIMLNF